MSLSRSMLQIYLLGLSLLLAAGVVVVVHFHVFSGLDGLALSLVDGGLTGMLWGGGARHGCELVVREIWVWWQQKGDATVVFGFCAL